MGMRANRAKQPGTRVRVVTNDLEGFNGMRPFHTKRFGEIVGHNSSGKKINGYIINMSDGSQLTLTRTQFATSSIDESYKYAVKRK